MTMIRNNVGLLPGGFIYTDPKTGYKWDDTHSFLEDRVKQVLQHRLGNPTIFTDALWLGAGFISQQIQDYNCGRLGNDPSYCYDANPPVVKSLGTAKKCTDCGVDLNPVMCKSCGGSKINGYSCPSCGKQYGI
jgi:hypothetical protein